jgi:hypothetical protein
MRVLYGLLIIALGVAILKYRYQIHNITGDWGWAEQYLGGNGTVSAISLIGAFLIAVGTAYPFGVVDITPDATRIPGLEPL